MKGTKCPAIEGLEFLKGNADAVPVPGKVTVVEFWATWCPPCRTSIPHLTEIQKKYAGKVVVVGVTNEDAAACKPFVDQQGSSMDYVVASDAEESAYTGLMEPSGSRGIPTAFVVDAEGTITFFGHPMQPDFETAIEDAVRKMKPAKVTASREELNSKSVGELKAILRDHGVSSTGCVEKSDIVNLIVEKCT